MRVIFVGHHDKPNTPPLSRLTKSGKLLQRVIEKLPDIEFMKSNLYDIDHYPNSEDDRFELELDWHYRINPNPKDLIILLGADTHKHFLYDKTLAITLKFAHPASKRSYKSMDEYVDKMINAINQPKTIEK